MGVPVIDGVSLRTREFGDLLEQKGAWDLGSSGSQSSLLCHLLAGRLGCSRITSAQESSTIKGHPPPKDTCAPALTAALFIIAQTWKQPRRPLTEEWIQKKRRMYTMNYYSA